jgi:hypothetical protein
MISKIAKPESQIWQIRLKSRTDMELKVGDRVVWFKRIPGGDYVYPVTGKVLGFTEKRVKIEADDDGEIGIRYVNGDNLQKSQKLE